jgi:hypothetical protein
MSDLTLDILLISGRRELGARTRQITSCINELMLMWRCDAKVGKVVVIQESDGAERVEAFGEEFVRIFAQVQRSEPTCDFKRFLLFRGFRVDALNAIEDLLR